MREFRLRTDLQRMVIDGFAMPLGFAPLPDEIKAPPQGFTVTYNVGEADEPDTYSFHITVSHERVREVLGRAFELLPDEVVGIVEIGSRDAYRSTDVYLGSEPMPREHFLKIWREFEEFLLEDTGIAAGANTEEPFMEIFLDQFKGIALHVPMELKEDVERMLAELRLTEIAESDEPQPDEPAIDGSWDEDETRSGVRPVLDTSDPFLPDLDEMLLQLRHAWGLELNVDVQTNVDETGRSLGPTLWHVVAIAEPVEGDPAGGAYCDIWATATSMSEVERLIDHALADYPDWRLTDVYTIDRVAFDERPDELADLRPADKRSRVHLVRFDRWSEPAESPKPPMPPEAPGTSRHRN